METSSASNMMNSTNNVNRNPNSAALIAFKPRQVLLAEQRTKFITMSMKQTKTQTPEQKTLLLHSTIKYLENIVSSKTLKRILNDAQIENEEWTVVSLDLEDMYCKYLDSRYEYLALRLISNQLFCLESLKIE